MTGVELAGRQPGDAQGDAQRARALLEHDDALGLLSGRRRKPDNGGVAVFALAGMTVMERMTLVRGRGCGERRSTCHGCERDDETAVSHASPSLGCELDERELLDPL